MYFFLTRGHLIKISKYLFCLLEYHCHIFQWNYEFLGSKLSATCCLNLSSCQVLIKWVKIKKKRLTSKKCYIKKCEKMSYLENLNYLHLPEHIMHLHNALFVSTLFSFLQCLLILPFIPIFRMYHLQGLAKYDLSFEVVSDLSRKNELFLPLQVLCTYSAYNITTILYHHYRKWKY